MKRELVLKALLVLHAIAIPKTHDLVRLLDLLKSREPTLALITDLCHRLNPYAVEFRYPGEFATRREATWAAGAAQEIRQTIRPLIIRHSS